MPVFLYTLTDPDSSDHTWLHIAIETGLDAKADLALLDRFDDEWWLDNSPRTDGKITIDTE